MLNYVLHYEDQNGNNEQYAAKLHEHIIEIIGELEVHSAKHEKSKHTEMLW